MKKNILFLILAVALSFPSVSFAQTNNATTQCTGAAGINVFNYNFCCKSVAGAAANKTQCDAYNARNSGTTTTTTSTVPPSGSIMSGGTINPSSSVDTAGGAVPRSSSASLNQCSSKFTSLLDILIWAKCIIVIAIVPMIFVLAFLFFIWGVMRFIQASDSVKKEESKKFILWGIIGLFVMTSVWGIIKIVSTTVGIDKTAVPFLQTEYLKKK